jgi:MFS family permease
MNPGDAPSAGQEWRRYWPLPVAAAVGYSMLGLQTYAIGPFVVPLEAEFGWSRAEVMMGLTLSNIVGVCVNLIIGMAVDRLGPRRVALSGLVVKAGAFALLATATGTILNWSLLWVLVAFGAMLVQSTVWSSAVASRKPRSAAPRAPARSRLTAGGRALPGSASSGCWSLSPSPSCSTAAGTTKLAPPRPRRLPCCLA